MIRAGRLSLGPVLSGAIIVSLVRPTSWVVGLAGFLAGGGLVLVAGPILVLPTLTGLQTMLGGPLTTLVFGTPAAALALLAVGVAALVMAVAVAGALAGGWAERRGIGIALDAAAEEGITAPVSLDGAPGIGRVAVLRLLALVPVVVVLAICWSPLYDTVYRELILPSELVTPLPVRVILDVPWILAALGITWLLADSAAAIAVRRLVVERRPTARAWLDGWIELVRRPYRVLPAATAGLLVLALLMGPSLVAAQVGWTRVRDILLVGRDPVVTLLSVVVWVAVYLGCLVLAGVASAIRAAAMTLVAVRRA